MAAHLVGTPGGTAHQDHYPFYIVDFAWEALQARRDEFLAKDDETESARPKRSEPLRGGSFYFSSSRVIARTTSHQSGHDEDGEWLA